MSFPIVFLYFPMTFPWFIGDFPWLFPWRSPAPNRRLLQVAIAPGRLHAVQAEVLADEIHVAAEEMPWRFLGGFMETWRIHGNLVWKLAKGYHYNPE